VIASGYSGAFPCILAWHILPCERGTTGAAADREIKRYYIFSVLLNKSERLMEVA
jgi:hypothetical protein